MESDSYSGCGSTPNRDGWFRTDFRGRITDPASADREDRSAIVESNRTRRRCSPVRFALERRVSVRVPTRRRHRSISAIGTGRSSSEHGPSPIVTLSYTLLNISSGSQSMAHVFGRRSISRVNCGRDHRRDPSGCYNSMNVKFGRVRRRAAPSRRSLFINSEHTGALAQGNGRDSRTDGTARRRRIGDERRRTVDEVPANSGTRVARRRSCSTGEQ